VKGKSLLHSHLSITTCILITLFIYLLLCINMMGPM
jgi:preprotein translocase subunit SecG